MADTERTSVAVLGGGITGLSCAWRLEQLGLDVTIYEATGRLGGQIRTTRTDDGYLVESGPHTLLERTREMAELIEALGLRSRQLEANPTATKRFVVRDGRPLPVPTSPGEFFQTELLSTQAKLRLFAEAFIGRGSAEVDESLANFVVRRLGQEALDYAVGPLVAGIFAGEPRLLSVRHAFTKLYDLEQRHGSLLRGAVIQGFSRLFGSTDPSAPSRKLFSFDDGSAVLTDAIADALAAQVCLESPVTGLSRATDGAWTVAFRRGDVAGQAEHAAVVSALPAHALAGLELVSGATHDLTPFGEVVYAPVSIVGLGFNKADVGHPLDGFGALIPQPEERSILGTLFMSTLFDGRAPEGHALLTNFIGGARQPELALRPTDELVERTLVDLRALLDVRGEPDFVEHIAWKQAIPQYEVGYGRFHELAADIERASPGLTLTGNFRDGVAVPDLVAAGFGAAETAADYALP